MQDRGAQAFFILSKTQQLFAIFYHLDSIFNTRLSFSREETNTKLPMQALTMDIFVH